MLVEKEMIAAEWYYFTFPLCESRGLVKGNIGIPRFWFPVVMKTQGPVNEKLYKEIPLDEAEKDKTCSAFKG